MSPRPRFGIMTAPSQVTYPDIVRVWREADAIPDIEHHPIARREYEAHGLHYDDFSDSMEALGEALTVIRRLWTEDESFDFAGNHVQLTGAFGNPKPVQKPHPPIITGGRSARLLRITAEHADLWNIPGGDIDDTKARSALLDRYCDELGRDPGSIVRSMHIQVSYDQPGTTRTAIDQALEAGFEHLVLGLPDPYPAGVAQWVADELIARSA